MEANQKNELRHVELI
jgi:hypothetical protein